ncbi:thiamine pyrophosphate-binding protein [Actinomyces bowdenii]|uniref:2-succinyl-5-enolpyruvyl-6-hydroxy-3-cyclohexene-1-carboxylate synthase n=1 Tax=Actinomyces bowdenii TaxID=131109 RepID=A0A3P1V775_9ACTO|nr:thiamine pyrophosphate-binding protein [Actinomyces bowdenii]RRD29517.1 2-succinyl-5-enolpyruvyl-6-hydroxy-3-cyclohexene-1-carboxylic-acid synthase [Actinomyces bowdenii]
MTAHRRGPDEAEPPNPSTAAASSLVGALVEQGVREVVLCPGSRSAPLAYALAQAQEEGALSLRVVLDERSAAFIALGLARAHALTGRLRPAAVVTTSGTAAANLHPAVCEADAAGIPLLLLTADRPHELVGTGASQTTEQTRLFGDASRLVVDLPADLSRDLGPGAARAAIAGQVRRCVAAATGALSRDPGPAQINIRLRPPLAPQDAAGSAEAADGAGAAPAAGGVPGRAGAGAGGAVAPEGGGEAVGAGSVGGPERVAPVTGGRLVLQESWMAPECRFAGERAPRECRGVVVAGDTALPGVGQAARALAEQLDWPLLAEPTSHARAGGHALTHYAELLASPAGRELAGRVTDIVVAGHPSLSRGVSALLSGLLGPGARLHVLADRARWSDTAGTATTVLPLDPRAGERQVGGIIAALGLSPARQWLAAWKEATQFLARQERGAPQGGLPGREGRACPEGSAREADLTRQDELGSADGSAGCAHGADGRGASARADAAAGAVWEAALVPGGPLLFLGSSMTLRRLDRIAAPAGAAAGPTAAPPTAAGAPRPPAALANRGLAGIDGTLATAVGVALGAKRPVRAVVGDLTFLHDAMSLGRGAMEEEPDLQVLVIDDGGGAIFSTLEYAALPPAQRFTRLFTTPQAADIPALAAALGARVHRPADLPRLRDLLARPVRGLSVIVWETREGAAYE